MGRKLTKEEIASIERGDTIAIMWGIDDVLAQANDDEVEITEDEARKILAHLDDYHDANEGISWTTISVVTDMFLEDKKKGKEWNY